MAVISLTEAIQNLQQSIMDQTTLLQELQKFLEDMDIEIVQEEDYSDDNYDDYGLNGN